MYMYVWWHRALGLTRIFLISPRTIMAFIGEIRAGYNDARPFHNFQHATFVLQGCYAMLRECDELSSMLTAADRLAICIAAIGHDIGHTGTSNAFLINHGSRSAFCACKASGLMCMFNTTFKPIATAICLTAVTLLLNSCRDLIVCEDLLFRRNSTRQWAPVAICGNISKYLSGIWEVYTILCLPPGALGAL